jgi:hypothetical protein
MSDAGVNLETEALQLGGDQRRRARFTIAELGILMDVAPPFDDLTVDLGSEPVDVGAEIRRGLHRRAPRRDRDRRCGHDETRGDDASLHDVPPPK